MKKYTMKDSIFTRVQTDLELRAKIANAKGIDGSSVRKSAINKSTTLSEKNCLEIIKSHLNLKDSDIFEITNLK